MIAAGDIQDFAPFGRDYFRVHPKESAAPVNRHWHWQRQQRQRTLSAVCRSDLGVQLVTALKGVSLKDKQDIGRESWQIRSDPTTNELNYEEELYFYDRTVVWSKGNVYKNRVVHKTFTANYPVQQALWCDIYTAPNKPIMDTKHQDEISEGIYEAAICIVDNSNLNFFTNKGQEFTTALPFQVIRAWPIKYGLLLERGVSASERKVEKNDKDKDKPERDRDRGKLPTIFSVLHPLDEITPVVKNCGKSNVSFVNDHELQVVFTSVDPSFIMFYNRKTGIHSIYRIRRIKSDELEVVMNLNDTTTCASLFTTTGSTTRLSQSMSNSSAMRSFTHLAPMATHSQSFSGLTQMAALSRSQSPSGCEGQSYHHHYPYSLSKNMTESLFPESLGDHAKPLPPDICLDLLWVETPSVLKQPEEGNATSVFITQNFVDERFFCFVVANQNQLKVIKFEETDEENISSVFGPVSTISARDAVPLENCKMMLVLEVGYTLFLYSGNIKVCKVYIPSAPSPFSNLETPHRYPIVSSRRTSLVTANQSLLAIDDEGQFLSPVVADLNDKSIEMSYYDEPCCSTSIIKLHDPVHNRVTVETSNNVFQRVTIPKLVESSLVDSCLQAARSILPQDLSIQLYIKWYSTVNTLGNSRDNRCHEWSVFVACLLGLMGYNLEQLAVAKQLEINLSFSPGEVTKKFKSGDGGSDEDWNYLLSSNQNEQNGCMMENLFGLPKTNEYCSKMATSGNINSRALLFPHIPALLYVLHLVYEELKLKVNAWNDLESMAPLLMQLARDLRVQSFLDSYWRDFPRLYIADEKTQIQENVLTDMTYPAFLTSEPPSVFQWIHRCLSRSKMEPFPYISYLNPITEVVVTLFAAMMYEKKFTEISPQVYLRKIAVSGSRFLSTSFIETNFQTSLNDQYNVHEMLVILMTRIDFTLKNLENLPIGVALPLRNAIFQCRRNPPSTWSEKTYNLIGREDLLVQLKSNKKSLHEKQNKSKIKNLKNAGEKPALIKDEDDGMENLDDEVLKMRFSNDQRVHEVRRLLQSSKPVRVYICQRPEVSDHDFVEEQERFLYGMCMRTMALCVGRGMFTLHTSRPVVTETLPIPKLCLTGRAPPKNTTVDLSHIDPPPNMNTWPLFHNGVAAGLRISPYATQIDSTWIVYNKPKGANEMPMEHAGFLMSLGLNGHLNNLAIMNIHDYLCKGHEMTSVGLILGIAAAKRGTMDMAITKLLSIHVEALLPPTSTELDVPHVVQVAAILGIGLVYQGTNHRHMSEVLLTEIGRPPGPEMENSSDRESYSLAAGLALVSGNDTAGRIDLSMSDQLYHYMVGGHKRSLLGIHKEKYKSPSYQIKEGESVNIDVTSPGATLALAMMYFKTGNNAVASWMAVPETQFLLDFVRPDFLLLRTFSKSLILWDDVLPSSKWVESHIPKLVSSTAFKKNKDDETIDYETMNQAYCNIIAGACLALGFRFAGSASEEAYATLTKYVKMFISVTCKHTGEPAGRSTLENCLNVTVLSLAMVMAGTGDLEVLRICRFMHFRLGQSNNFILYGSHLATHMALGLLFLGGGAYTLSTEPFAVAAMICAFFPKFPIHSSDNRYHLQAFRHLYVLAVEPRLVIPRDIVTNSVSYTELSVKFKDTKWYKNVNYKIKAPCFLPELDLLDEVSVDDPRYWPIKFCCDKNWKSLKSLLNNRGTLFVKQKAGYLSYVEDPRGFRSVLTQSLTKDNVGNWSTKPDAIEAFSKDPNVLNFTKYFLQDQTDVEDAHLKQILCNVLFECVTQEKLEFFSTYVSLLQTLREIESASSPSNNLWQIKLAVIFSDALVKQNYFTAT
uniref:Uncharacterized protein n=1 Tax=Strigamia maritima TaxID=126957 RepID=T1J8K9_STRMM